MFVAERTRISVREYLWRPDIQALIASKAVQEALYKSLSASRIYANARQESSLVDEGLAKTPIGPV